MDQPTQGPGMDPSRVDSPAALATCLDALRRRRALSYEAMERAARKLPSRPGGHRWEPLGKSTVGEIVTGKRLPTKAKLLVFLAVCEVPPADRAQWLAAWERAATAELDVPAGAVRVREARPRSLGVHAAIRQDGTRDDLPPYVVRDMDVELRAVLARGAEAGGFVLLVGGSSVGKTRTLYEAVLATVPDWWLIHPDRDRHAWLRALAAAPVPRLVIWLDELQRYLGAPGGLTAGTVRQLQRAGMLVATIWPDEYAIRIVPRQFGRDHQTERDRELLDLAQVFDVADAFTATELAHAQALAAVDPRIDTALNFADGGLTQVLAAGPELVRRWEQAPDPYAKAVLTAVLDVRRLGAESPVTTEFLVDASAEYLTSTQRATAPAHWLRSALTYGATPLHGATSALLPVDDGTIGGLAGYAVADYLLQYGQRVRATVRPPDSFWRTVSAHVTDAEDLGRLAHSASGYGLLPVAEQLWLAAIAAGHPATRRSLAHDLEARGRLADAERVMRDAVAAGEPHTRIELSHLLKEQGRLAEAEQLWRDGIASGDGDSWAGLVDLLAGQKRIADAERLAQDALGTGEPGARTTLGWLLEVQDRLDEAEQVLRQAAAEDPDGIRGLAWRRLAGVLARLGRHDEAERMLQQAIEAGTPDARRWLAGILDEQGRYDQAERILRENLADDHVFGLTALFGFLQRHGRSEEAERLGRDGVARHDHFVRYDLIRLLDEQERFDEAEEILRRAVAGGASGAWLQLAELFEKNGRADEAELLRRKGMDAEGSTSNPR